MSSLLKRLLKHPTRENPDFMEISSVLDDLRSHITSQTLDIAWSSFSSVDEFTNKLTDLSERIRVHDSSAILELKLLFMPTGDFQEIAISSGWSSAYIKLSSRFDWATGDRA